MNIRQTNTHTFTTTTEAQEFLTTLGYERDAEVSNPILGRFTAHLWDDAGREYVSYANVAGSSVEVIDFLHA